MSTENQYSIIDSIYAIYDSMLDVIAILLKVDGMVVLPSDDLLPDAMVALTKAQRLDISPESVLFLYVMKTN